MRERGGVEGWQAADLLCVAELHALQALDLARAHAALQRAKRRHDRGEQRGPLLAEREGRVSGGPLFSVGGGWDGLGREASSGPACRWRGRAS